MIKQLDPHDDLHDAALMLVQLHEERRRLEDEQQAERKLVDEAEKQQFLEERRLFTTRIKGEALMFANQVRTAKIMNDIEDTRAKNESIWKRIKTLVGWA